MTTICKTILTGTSPQQIREQTEGLAPARLRDLAARLAARRDLTVSVITYDDDGAQELEVLHTGPPHRTEHTIDCRKFTRQPGPPGWTPVHSRAIRPARRCAPDPPDPGKRRRPVTAPPGLYCLEAVICFLATAAKVRGLSRVGRHRARRDRAAILAARPERASRATSRTVMTRRPCPTRVGNH